MSTHIDIKDRAKEIRRQLAVLGWGRRHVSVRISRYSMGESIRVEILTPSVRGRDVETIAATQEDVRRDETGDILSGGNTYVHVSYSDTALEGVRVLIEDELRGLGPEGGMVMGCFAVRPNANPANADSIIVTHAGRTVVLIGRISGWQHDTAWRMARYAVREGVFGGYEEAST